MSGMLAPLDGKKVYREADTIQRLDLVIDVGRDRLVRRARVELDGKRRVAFQAEAKAAFAYADHPPGSRSQSMGPSHARRESVLVPYRT